MSNMSYCRFRNTLQDLRDCYSNINDDLTGEEFEARNDLINLCKELAEYDEDDFIEAIEYDEE